MKLIYLKSSVKSDSLDGTIGIKTSFFRVSVTIEPGRSLLRFVTTNCLINNNSSDTSCSTSINVSPFGQLSIPLIKSWKFKLNKLALALAMTLLICPFNSQYVYLPLEIFISMLLALQVVGIEIVVEVAVV